MNEKDLDLIIKPLTINYLDIFNQYSESNKFDHSNIVTYIEDSAIASKPHIGSQELFDYFKCFETEVYLSMLLSVIILSAIMTIQSNNFKLFFEYFWNLCILFFSKSIQNFMLKINSMQKSMFGFWLLTSLFLSILFSSFLLDYAIKGQPLITIDSIEDLSKSNQMKFYIDSFSPLYTFANRTNSIFAKSIKQRLIGYSKHEEFLKPFQQKLIDGLRSGTHGLVMNRLYLISYLLLLTKMDKTNENKLINTLHISTNRGELLPTFIAFNSKIELIIRESLNKMYVNSNNDLKLSFNVI